MFEFLAQNFAVAGGVLAAIPLLLHMLRRTPAVRMPFSLVRFLSPTLPKTTRRSRIENWPLMLLRGTPLYKEKATYGFKESTDLRIPLDAYAAGLGDYRIVTTLCPGGKERMRRLMAVVASGRVDVSPLVTHRFRLDDIEAAYELFANQRDGVMKVAITP